MMPSSLTTWPPKSNFTLKQWIACQMKAQTKSYKMRARVAGLSSKNVDEFLPAAPSMQPLSWTSKSATPSKTSWSQFESIDDGWHLKRKPKPSPSLFTCTLIPFDEQIIVQQGSKGQHRRPQMCILKSPWSRASDSSNANWPWLQRWAHQIIALLLVFTICTYISDSLEKFVANTGSVPNFGPPGTGADEKYLQDSYGMSPRTPN